MLVFKLLSKDIHYIIHPI